MKRLALLFLLLVPLLSGIARAQDHIDIAGLTFRVPRSWQGAPPATPMRAAQWTIPASKEGAPDGEVVAFFFGAGQGGDVQANLNRWSSTMTTPQGTPAAGQTATRKVGDISVTELDLYGTYANSMATPGLPAVPQPGFGLIGAILEYTGGPIFVRLTGPESLVRSQLPAFTKFIDSAKPKK